jgi:hypothetical protein
MKGSIDMAIRTGSSSISGRWMMVAVLAGVALFGSYAFAQAQGAGAVGSDGDVVSAVAASATTGGGAAVGGGCCGSGAQAPTSAQASKAAEVVGGVQRISVDASKGYYDPSVIELKAGVPAEITFSAASGCTGYVRSADLGFAQDLTTGAKTVKLAALQAGTYGFECGMGMVFGSIVVK